MSVSYKSHGRVDHIDCHVSNKIKIRRLLLGFSQEVLGKALSISIQQIQKYEKGMNRISSANLYRIGKILDVPISYFFDEVDKELPESASAVRLEDCHMNEGANFSLLRSFNGIVCPQARKNIIELVDTLSSRG